MNIKKFVFDEHWNFICEIHDAARPGELEGSAPQKAFVPLEKCYIEEKLLEDKIYIGEVDNKIVGFVAFNSSNITWLYVHPSIQGKGYGRQLLQFAVKKTEQPTKVLVLNNNSKAISLYKSEGFVILESTKGTIPIANVDVECYRMIFQPKPTLFNNKDSMKEEGFKDFYRLGDLRMSFPICRDMSKKSKEEDGVYFVVCPFNEFPQFIEKETVGKSVPAKSIQELEKQWISDSPWIVVYIGSAGMWKSKEDKSKVKISKRLKDYMRFGNGTTNGHKGGRDIFQIENFDNLIVCYKTLGNKSKKYRDQYDPRTVESKYIEQFKEFYDGKRPFANQID